MAAGDVEGDHHPVSGLDVLYLGPDLLDDPHRLVTEDVALVDEHPQHSVEVQVRTADRGRGDTDDRVVGLLDRGIGNLVDPHVFIAVECERFHRSSSSAVPGSAIFRCISAFALSGRTRLAAT